MASQQDLDQGGTFRQWQKIYLGPSVGWQYVPNQSFLPVTAAGDTEVNLSTTLILVNVDADGTRLLLPSSKASSAGPQAQPGTFMARPVSIIDVGGHAFAHPITIVPFGTETIDGLASLQIGTDYGAFTINPNIDTGGWTLTQ